MVFYLYDLLKNITPLRKKKKKHNPIAQCNHKATSQILIEGHSTNIWQVSFKTDNAIKKKEIWETITVKKVLRDIKTKWNVVSCIRS